MNNEQEQRIEGLGPAERIINTLLAHNDHMVHNRPGVVSQDGRTVTGVRWAPVTYKVEGEGDEAQKIVYRKDKVGKKTNLVRMGVLGDDDKVRNGGQVVGRYQHPGLFEEVAAWMYRQVAEVYKLDHDFAAHWASYAFGQEHRDMKVVLCAFMLVQDHYGAPVREGGEVLFHDDDFREVGEAMMLIRRRDKKDLNPKLLLRVGDLLRLDAIAEINRELGFGNSAKNPAMGRYDKAVTKWLRQREHNIPMLEGLVKAGFRKATMQLAQRVGYKPETPEFFRILRWKQKQADDGRREIAIGEEVEAAESWEGLSEAEVCQRIVDTKPNYKRIVGLVPKELGITRAIMAASIEAGSLSNSDLIILGPTLEDLGLLEIAEVRERWEKAVKVAEDQRAANIAQRMKKKENVDKLEEAADNAAKKAVEEVVRGLRVCVGVDISASMHQGITAAKQYIPKLLVGIPLEKMTVAVFNTAARQVEIPHASSKGVEHAFKRFRAGGATNYGSAVRDVFKDACQPEPDEDVIMFWIGDQQQRGTFTREINNSGLNPVAFGLLHIGRRGPGATIVEDTARELGIPCFPIDAEMFEEGDPYSVPRTLRHLIAATPVGQGGAAPKRRRHTLVETILNTPKLQKPVWA